MMRPSSEGSGSASEFEPLRLLGWALWGIACLSCGVWSAVNDIKCGIVQGFGAPTLTSYRPGRFGTGPLKTVSFTAGERVFFDLAFAAMGALCLWYAVARYREWRQEEAKEGW